MKDTGQAELLDANHIHVTPGGKQLRARVKRETFDELASSGSDEFDDNDGNSSTTSSLTRRRARGTRLRPLRQPLNSSGCVPASTSATTAIVGPFCCPFCFTSIKTILAFTRHLKDHKDVEIYACLQCRKGFRTLDSFSEHECEVAIGSSNDTGKKSHKSFISVVRQFVFCGRCGEQICEVTNDTAASIGTVLAPQQKSLRRKGSRFRLISVFSDLAEFNKATAVADSDDLAIVVPFTSCSKSMATKCLLCTDEGVHFNSPTEFLKHLSSSDFHQNQGDFQCGDCLVAFKQPLAYHDHVLNECGQHDPSLQAETCANVMDFFRSVPLPQASDKEHNYAEWRKVYCDLCLEDITAGTFNEHDCASSYTRRFLAGRQVVKCPSVMLMECEVDGCAKGCVEIPSQLQNWFLRNLLIKLCPLESPTEQTSALQHCPCFAEEAKVFECIACEATFDSSEVLSNHVVSLCPANTNGLSAKFDRSASASPNRLRRLVEMVSSTSQKFQPLLKRPNSGLHGARKSAHGQLMITKVASLSNGSVGVRTTNAAGSVSALDQVLQQLKDGSADSESSVARYYSFATAPLAGMELGRYQMQVLSSRMIPADVHTDFAAILAPSDQRQLPYYLVHGDTARRLTLIGFPTSTPCAQLRPTPSGGGMVINSSNSKGSRHSSAVQEISAARTNVGTCAGSEQAWSCPICQSSFISSEFLGRHLKSDHIFPCLICNRCFVSKAYLDAHTESCKVQISPDALPYSRTMVLRCTQCDVHFLHRDFYKHLIDQHPNSINFVVEVGLISASPTIVHIPAACSPTQLIAIMVPSNAKADQKGEKIVHVRLADISGSSRYLGGEGIQDLHSKKSTLDSTAANSSVQETHNALLNGVDKTLNEITDTLKAENGQTDTIVNQTATKRISAFKPVRFKRRKVETKSDVIARRCAFGVVGKAMIGFKRKRRGKSQPRKRVKLVAQGSEDEGNEEVQMVSSSADSNRENETLSDTSAMRSSSVAMADRSAAATIAESSGTMPNEQRANAIAALLQGRSSSLSCEMCHKTYMDESALIMHLLSHGFMTYCFLCQMRLPTVRQYRMHFTTSHAASSKTAARHVIAVAGRYKKVTLTPEASFLLPDKLYQLFAFTPYLEMPGQGNTFTEAYFRILDSASSDAVTTPKFASSSRAAAGFEQSSALPQPSLEPVDVPSISGNDAGVPQQLAPAGSLQRNESCFSSASTAELEICEIIQPSAASEHHSVALADDADDDCAIVDEVSLSSDAQRQAALSEPQATSSSRVMHPCETCKKKFKTTIALKEHMMTHANDAGVTCEEELPIPPGKVIYACRICSIAYSSKDMFVAHTSRHNSFFSCSECSSIAFSREAMIVHVRCHAQMAYGCSICFKAFRSEFSLHMHLACVHGFALIWMCKPCCFAHNDMQTVIHHIQTVHADLVRSSTVAGDLQKAANQYLAVCAHRKLHYQPSPGEQFVLPSSLPAPHRPAVGDCAHRSFLATNETLMVCRSCGTMMPAVKFMLESDELRATGQLQLQIADEFNQLTPVQINISLNGDAYVRPPHSTPQMASIPTALNSLPLMNAPLLNAPQHQSAPPLISRIEVLPNHANVSAVAPTFNGSQSLIQAFMRQQQQQLHHQQQQARMPPIPMMAMPPRLTPAPYQLATQQVPPQFYAQQPPRTTILQAMTRLGSVAPPPMPAYSVPVSAYPGHTYARMPTTTAASVVVPRPPIIAGVRGRGRPARGANMVDAGQYAPATPSSRVSAAVDSVLSRQQAGPISRPVPSGGTAQITATKPLQAFQHHVVPSPPESVDSNDIIDPESTSCNICNTKMSSVASLRVHLLRHNPLETHFCLECGQWFRNRSGLFAHMSERHQNKMKQLFKLCCRKCSRTFGSPAAFTAHKHHDFDVCKLCGLSFFSKQAFRGHEKQHQLNGPCCCLFCGICMKTAGDFDAHVMQDHAIDQWSMCRECGLCYKATAQLKDHFETKHQAPSDRQYSGPWCRVCSVLLPDDTLPHVRKHHEVLAFKLKLSITLDVRHESLVGINHNNTHPTPASPSVSGASAASTAIVDDNEWPSVAPKMSRDPKVLAIDLWVCQHCRRIFFEPTEFRAHYAAHPQPGFWLLRLTRDRSNVALCNKANCSFCDFVSLKRDQMYEHLKAKHSHLGYFPCILDCGETFGYRDDRDYHLQFNHNVNVKSTAAAANGTKSQHFCLFCSLAFDSEAELCKHLLAMHAQGKGNLIGPGQSIIFMCTVCGLCFNDDVDLQIHVKNHKVEAFFKASAPAELQTYFGMVVQMREREGTLTIFCKYCRQVLKFGASVYQHFLQQHAGAHRKQIEQIHSKCLRGNALLHEATGCCRVCRMLNRPRGDSSTAIAAAAAAVSSDDVSVIDAGTAVSTSTYPCASCSLSFPSPRKLRLHQSEAHDAASESLK